MVCTGPICYNDPSPIVVVHSPAHIEPDDRNLFYPGSTVCPFVRTLPWASRNMTRCHFMCSCDQWVDEDGFCDSQFVVIVSSTAISLSKNDVKLCGLLERTLALPWMTLGTTRNVRRILRLLDTRLKPISSQRIFCDLQTSSFLSYYLFFFSHEDISVTTNQRIITETVTCPSSVFRLEHLAHDMGTLPHHWPHDDVIKWEQFPRNWPFVRGIHRSPVNSPHKGQWRGPLMFSLICLWINAWVNTREAGDLRRHRAHYDVILMFLSIFLTKDLRCRALI